MNRLRVWLPLLVGFLVGAALAAPPTPSPEEKRAQHNFRGGVLIGNVQEGTAVSKITKGTRDYDFPSLTAAAAELDTVCAYSPAITVKGVAFGDVCMVGVDQVPVNAFGTLIPYVTAAGQVKVQACAVGITDGGSFNMPDAGYHIRCLSP